MKQKVKLTARYEGHVVKKNQLVDLNLSCRYDQLPMVVQIAMGLNVDVDVAVLFETSSNPSKMGVVRIHSIHINSDGASRLRLNSSTDFIELEVLNDMSHHGDEDIEVYLKYELEIEEEEG